VKKLFATTLCQEEYVLSSEEVAGIEQLEQQYLKEEFIHRL
jgi:lipoic acid synthetase/lipoate-protein ligase A